MKIILGVSASIAIYKACDICRELAKAGHDVHVVMTRTAATWINPILFEALSNNPVVTDTSTALSASTSTSLPKRETEDGRSAGTTASGTRAETNASESLPSARSRSTVGERSRTMAHIDIRSGADLMLIAPASADLIARAAEGRADDILTATLLAYTGPRYLAPAMNPSMYAHPATQKNIATCKSYGYHILDSANGEAVCGDVGQGKMMAVADVLRAVAGHAGKK